MQGKKRIGILLSGRTGQRELGLRQGEAITSGLASLGHEGVPLFLDRDLDLLVRQAKISTAFLAVQGRQAEDGCIQGFLELMRIPYTGSGVLASALSCNRVKTKEILRFHNLPTAPGYVFDAAHAAAAVEAHGQFGFPVTVRPVHDRLLVVDNLAYDEMELEAALDDVLRNDRQALIERHLSGRTVEVGMLDGVPLGALELSRDTGSPARAGGMSVPCRLPEERLRSILRLATLSYDALGCTGAATVQIQVSEKGNELIRDVDSMPIMTPTAVLPRLAKMAGLGFPELVGRLLRGAALRAQAPVGQRLLNLPFSGFEQRPDFPVTAH